MSRSLPQSAQTGLPSTEVLLASGGDERIVCDAQTGMNQYSCRPFPDPELVPLGSSTASVISTAAYAAADKLRQRLLATAAAEEAARTYRREIGRIRQALREQCGLADLPGLDIVLAASGTDLHLIAGQLASAGSPAPVLAIMVDPAETGRHVPVALAGRLFCPRPAVAEGDDEPEVEGLAVQVATVPIRLADGTSRPAAEVDTEVEALASQAVAQGQRVLLIMADCTKTGLIAPSLHCALSVRERFGAAVDVLVDACQFRIAPTTLRSYLERGFMLALTGSKFVTGPCFSAALLLPAPLAQRYSQAELPPTLRNISVRADWPENWDNTALLDERANYGLLLRWEAALTELKAFQAQEADRVAEFFRAFADAIQRRLQEDPCFVPLPVPALDRSALQAPASWDRVQTILPFLLQRPGQPEAAVLNREQTAELYRQLQTDMARAGLNEQDNKLARTRFQLGQPVACGQYQGVPVSALRLCASARLAVEAAATPDGTARVIAQAMAALDKAALLLRLAQDPT